VKGVWILSLLESISREKVKSLKFVDEIEVYLAFPVMLREQFEIPIDVQSMLYFSCSAVTEEDLNNAADFIKSHIENREATARFLISQDKWTEALQKVYPYQINDLQKSRGDGSEDTLEAYNAGLVKLTMDFMEAKERL
jgi:hypothetical protein